MNPMKMASALCLMLVLLAPGVAAGEEVNKPVGINQTGCTCLVKPCACVCIKQTTPRALVVTLTGERKDVKEAKIVLTKCHDYKDLAVTPLAQDGPRFDSPTGPSFKDVVCEKAGKTYKFNVNGGPKNGKYDVFIHVEKTDGTVFCLPCGKVCVFPDPGPPVDITRGLDSPPGFTPEEAKKITDREHLPLVSGAVAGVGGGMRIGGPVPDSPYNYLERETPPGSGSWTKVAICYAGAPCNLPDGMAGRKLGSVSDDCNNRVELYATAAQFRLYYYDHEGSSFGPIGACLFSQAMNGWFVSYANECGKKKFSIVTQLNRDLTSMKINIFIFHVCTFVRKAVRRTLGATPPVPDEPIAGYPNGELTPLGQ